MLILRTVNVALSSLGNTPVALLIMTICMPHVGIFLSCRMSIRPCLIMNIYKKYVNTALLILGVKGPTHHPRALKETKHCPD